MSLNALATLLEVFFSIICQDRHTDTKALLNPCCTCAHVHRGNNKDYKGQYNAWGTEGTLSDIHAYTLQYITQTHRQKALLNPCCACARGNKEDYKRTIQCMGALGSMKVQVLTGHKPT